MLKNYFNIAIRNLLKHKSYSIISILSLVVGITCFIFLMLYVKYETTYDSFHEKNGRIYQIIQYFNEGDFFGYKYADELGGGVAPAFKREFPEVEYAARVKKSESTLTYNNNGYLAGGLLVDADFFNLFSFPLKKGDKNSALINPKTIVLTEKLAGKLFGNEDPIGRVVNHGYWGDFTVTGIVKDIPENTNLKFEYLLSFKTLYSRNKDIEMNWGSLNYQSYILLKEGYPYKEFEKKLTHIVDKYHPSYAKERQYLLLPMEDIHMSSHVLSQTAQSVDKKFIYLLISIAVIVLIVGCVNYMNLATARAGTRNKEVGIRKTVGANRIQLIKQFLSESFILTFVSIIISLLFICAMFPYFKEIAGNGIQLNVLSDSTTITGLLGLFVIVGFLSGGYPAFMLSSLKPVNILKTSSKNNAGGNHLKLRNILVVFQFCITIILVVAAIVIQKQIHFIKNSDIGYNRNNVVAVKMRDKESRINYQLIKNELAKNKNVIATAAANIEPVTIQNIGPTKIENESGEMSEVKGLMSNYNIDYDYLDLFNIKIISGRGFKKEFSGDIDKQVIINETAAKIIGLKNPIGKKLEREGKVKEIVGVVKDFHFTSMKTKIDPIMLTYSPDRFYTFFVKISDKNVAETLTGINTTFKQYSKSFVYDYTFMDDLYNKLYKKETDLAGIILSFSIITIAIASIGLFGLISFIAGRKTKEIGVRKILGASVIQVVWLIIREFFILLVIAIIIAMPAAYYFANSWLQDFVYRIDLSAWLFLLAISIIMIIAFLSIAQQTIKAAVANPVDSLRSE